MITITIMIMIMITIKITIKIMNLTRRSRNWLLNIENWQTRKKLCDAALRHCDRK